MNSNCRPNTINSITSSFLDLWPAPKCVDHPGPPLIGLYGLCSALSSISLHVCPMDISRTSCATARQSAVPGALLLLLVPWQELHCVDQAHHCSIAWQSMHVCLGRLLVLFTKCSVQPTLSGRYCTSIICCVQVMSSTK